MIFLSALYEYSTVFTMNSLYIPRFQEQNENDLEKIINLPRYVRNGDCNI